MSISLGRVAGLDLWRGSAQHHRSAGANTVLRRVWNIAIASALLGIGSRHVRAAQLSVVVLGGAVKAPPVFEGADLSGARVIADFPGVNLRRAKLVKTNLGVNIKNQGMGQMRTDLSGADLSEADLEGADLNRSMMSF